MFDFKNKPKPQFIKDEKGETENELLKENKGKEAADPVNLAENTEEKQVDVSGVKIHKMPEKFLVSKKATMRPTGKLGKMAGFKKNIIIGAVIGVVVIGLLSLGGWLLLKSIGEPQTNSNTNLNVNVANNTKKATPEEVKKETKDEEKQKKCSALNCELCTQQECLNLSDYCHLEDLCLRDYQPKKHCPDYVCLPGPKVKTEEVEQEKEGVEKEEKTKEGPELEELTLSKDSDFDLLTDIEESIWGTDPMKSDSDGDGYNDGVEVANLYNPTVPGSGTGKLADSNLIKIFTNSKYGYSIYYPSSWQQSESGGSGDNVMFISNTGEFVGVIVQKNFAGYLTAKDWYLSQNPRIDESDLEEILIGNWLGVKSPDKLNVYLISNNYIYTITYNIGLKRKLNYKTTFDMMLKSFRLFESPLD